MNDAADYCQVWYRVFRVLELFDCQCHFLTPIVIDINAMVFTDKCGERS